MSRRFLADAIPTGSACCVVRDGKSKAVVNSREVFFQNEKILRTIMLLNRVETLSIVGSKHRTGGQAKRPPLTRGALRFGPRNGSNSHTWGAAKDDEGAARLLRPLSGQTALIDWSSTRLLEDGLRGSKC